MNVLILLKLTNSIPARGINLTNLTKFKNLQLADPQFYRPESIDIIIGADHFFKVLREGRIENLHDHLIAQNSIFGWIMSGSIKELHQSAKGSNTGQIKNLVTHNYHIDINIDETLQRFWQIEDIPSCSPFSQEEIECEEHFKANLLRHDSGKYIVRLPFKQPCATLGKSLLVAQKRLHNLEEKFKLEPNLKNEYNKIIYEYINLGHLIKIPEKDMNKESYYLPHHAVTKSESTTTKLRVVFDGSSKSTSGKSINDILRVGPTIQPTLWTILLKFRHNKIAFTADIEQMYRQIMMSEEDQEFQRILWRPKTEESITHFKLTTVTFGMASSAFLATRPLQQNAIDFQQEYPEIAEEIHKKFYINDYLSGADTVEEAKTLKENLNYVLQLRGFNLRKWASNQVELRHQSLNEENSLVRIDEANSITKILGLLWNCKEDQLSFKVELPDESTPTKRSLISDASKVFDPLGLLSPSIVIAKMLFQKLWLRKLDWDDKLPDDIMIVWKRLKDELPQLELLKIPRFIATREIQIHGFCDASKRAYAAAIYIRCKNENGEVQTMLITSKTKVAHLKQISLPRLELSGVHLLAKLLTAVCATFPKNTPVYSWTDSTIVLAWLSDHPSKWKTFVANRVSQIQELLPRCRWNHVRSENNPADYASKGVFLNKLLSLDLWW